MSVNEVFKVSEKEYDNTIFFCSGLWLAEVKPKITRNKKYRNKFSTEKEYSYGYYKIYMWYIIFHHIIYDLYWDTLPFFCLFFVQVLQYFFLSIYSFLFLCRRYHKSSLWLCIDVKLNSPLLCMCCCPLANIGRCLDTYYSHFMIWEMWSFYCTEILCCLSDPNPIMIFGQIFNWFP